VAERRVDAARAFLARAASGSPGAAAAYRACGAALEAALGGARAVALDDVERAFARADAALLRAWLGALSRPERAALGRRIALRAGPRRPAVRRSSHRESLRAHLLDGARQAGLLCLRGTV
jgi:hypothetical protein